MICGLGGRFAESLRLGIMKQRSHMSFTLYYFEEKAMRTIYSAEAAR